MKLVSFTAGLGNQLFQYCFYRYLLNKFPNEKIYGYYNKKWLEKHGGIIIEHFLMLNYLVLLDGLICMDNIYALYINALAVEFLKMMILK